MPRGMDPPPTRHGRHLVRVRQWDNAIAEIDAFLGKERREARHQAATYRRVWRRIVGMSGEKRQFERMSVYRHVPDREQRLQRAHVVEVTMRQDDCGRSRVL